MKRIKYFTFLLVGLIFGSSCEDFMGDNIDPNRALKVSVDLMMPPVLFYSVLESYDHSEYGMYLSQCLTTGGRSQTGALAYQSGWEFLGMNRHPMWRRHFFDVGSNVNTILRYLEEGGNENYEAVARTMRLLSNQQTTDAFGDIPRSTAYTENPSYDMQEDIYEWMLQEADALIELYNSPQVTKETNLIMDQSIDRIYGGDMNKWKQFVYGIKARILLRQLPNQNTDAATCQKIIEASELALNNWVDPNYKFDGGTSVEQNCFWGRTNRAVNSWESRTNNLLSAIPTKYFMEDVMGYDPLTETVSDPRLPYLMTARGDEGSAGVDTTYRYLESNSGMPATHQSAWYPLLYDKVLTTDTSTICLLTKAELHFIVAEAAFWAGDKSKAVGSMAEGIRYHMNRMGVPGEEIEAYLMNPDVMPGSANVTLADIMKQKYIAMYLQPEQWTDLRRYAYSNDENGILYKGEVIYPGLRRPHNLYEAYWSTPNEWIQRLNYDPETEEKYNRTQLESMGAFQNPDWLKKPMIWGKQN